MGTLERFAGAVGLIVSSPLMALSAVVIKWSSPGPVLFRAERMGRDEVPFTMFKLRTMHQGAAAAGSITGGRDPRVFPAGQVLRSLKLDEIPQLVNVVRGEMSFFGPRPEAIDVVRHHYAPWMLESLEVPPGIVGPGSLGYFLEEDQLPDDPAAAERHYADVLLPLKIARELVYVRRRTFAYRCELLLRTLLGIVKMRDLMQGAAEREERAALAILASVGGQSDHEASSPPHTLGVGTSTTVDG